LGVAAIVYLQVNLKVKGFLTMRIGELANKTGVQTSAIRYYEEIGVLAPAARGLSGYRDYDSSAGDRVRFIKAAQQAGLTLTEITGIFNIRDEGSQPCGHVADLIDRKLEEISERITALNQTRRELKRLAKRAEQLDPQQCPPNAICQIISLS
jgi:MerR family copper efflux transcriptional regulator